ncbi:hypothetical protein Pint_15411 [Pistacia integerrima]|uniref:Uncharacterized protein n=1 Tax=Pistacia integerrima TaxID=434235 RepID=A0ACC0ZB79_9ROSI|nr:hypothetical protein Pint_15411 [Pistacia integerrima]
MNKHQTPNPTKPNGSLKNFQFSLQFCCFRNNLTSFEPNSPLLHNISYSTHHFFHLHIYLYLLSLIHISSFFLPSIRAFISFLPVF